MSTTDPTSGETAFQSGTDRVTALRNRADLKGPVEARRQELRQADRAQAMGLALLRRAANLTQVELAEELGVGQAAIAKLERRPDLLLSTLRGYIRGLGGHARLVVEFDGHSSVELDLDTLAIPRQAEPPSAE